MVTFNEESVLSRPFGRWGLVSMVEMGNDAACRLCGKEPEPQHRWAANSYLVEGN